jgi:hypothetical protein
MCNRLLRLQVHITFATINADLLLCAFEKFLKATINCFIIPTSAQFLTH